MSRGKADFLIIGGGIIGLSLARAAKRRHPGSRVALIEKENQCGAHSTPGSWTRSKPGIRAQLLVHIRERRLEMDFRYEGDQRSFHVLNAVSPAFTCAIPFCEFLFDQFGRMQLAA